MRVIGLIGGIGSGKSTVARFMAELGAAVIDADRIGHELLEPGSQAWRRVVAAFGRQILGPDERVDRKRLAGIVFGSPEDLARLNKIMHPLIGDVVRDQLGQYRGQGVGVVAIDAPLLIEAGWASLADELWVTVAPEAVIQRRLEEKMGLSHGEALARRRAQMPQKEREKHATAVIDTGGSLDELKAKVKELWQKRQFDTRQK